MAETKSHVSVFVETTKGASGSDDGEHVKIGLGLSGNQTLDLLLTTDRAVDVMGLIGSVLGQVKRIRSGNPNERYVYPVVSWQIAPQLVENLLTLALRMKDGTEVCFQIDKGEARHMLESLSVILGEPQIVTAPKGQVH